MKCPNCGDNLVFDPRKQRLVCKSCDSEFEINSIDDPESDENVEGPDDEGAKKNKPEKLKAKAEKAEEFNTSDENLEYTTFTCSSCGAGLVATYSESVLGFCPYCGGESILTSRMAGKRPNTIIPFSKTKEECCKQYLEKVNKMPLVPKDLKHEEYINEIRGIYMPYNLYRIKHDGEIHAQYSESHGDKTDYYNIDGDVKADVRIPFDGSSQLDDNIGDIVFPYDPSLEESFDEKYLASYYTELPDVSDESYLEEVREEAMQAEVRALKNDEDSGTYSAKEDQVNSKEKEKMRLTGKKIILSPVYFLTYKNMDRVCYTIIPGTKNDTKTMYAEIPVDRRGYLIILSILTLITFAALSFLPFVPTYKHTETLGIIALLTSIAMILQWMSYERSYKKIMKKSMYAEINKSTGKVIMVVFIVALILVFAAIAFVNNAFHLVAIMIGLPMMILSSKMKKSCKELNIRASQITFLLIVLMTIAVTVSYFMFFTDEVVYSLMTILVIPVALCFLSLIKTFNESCTRPLPHFERKGGHNSAKDL